MPMEEARGSRVAVVGVALVIGIVTLSTVAGRPRFAEYRAVDVLEILAAGMCFGIALVGLMRLWRKLPP
jgi:hypothetical protein